MKARSMLSCICSEKQELCWGPIWSLPVPQLAFVNTTIRATILLKDYSRGGGDEVSQGDMEGHSAQLGA